MFNNIWLSSDNHFGHSNINRLCKRPFASVKDMDESLIAIWNEYVKPNDFMYYLGDFTLSTLSLIHI